MTAEIIHINGDNMPDDTVPDINEIAHCTAHDIVNRAHELRWLACHHPKSLMNVKLGNDDGSISGIRHVIRQCKIDLEHVEKICESEFKKSTQKGKL